MVCSQTFSNTITTLKINSFHHQNKTRVFFKATLVKISSFLSKNNEYHVNVLKLRRSSIHWIILMTCQWLKMAQLHRYLYVWLWVHHCRSSHSFGPWRIYRTVTTSRVATSGRIFYKVSARR